MNTKSSFKQLTRVFSGEQTTLDLYHTKENYFFFVTKYSWKMKEGIFLVLLTAFKKPTVRAETLFSTFFNIFFIL